VKLFTGKSHVQIFARDLTADGSGTFHSTFRTVLFPAIFTFSLLKKFTFNCMIQTYE
jgi:hypothetical protein